jgi:hypothetical protein
MIVVKNGGILISELEVGFLGKRYGLHNILSVLGAGCN